MIANAICEGMVAQSRKDMAAARLADLERPVGEQRIDIDFYSPAERKKPAQDFDFHAHGYHYQGTGSRWCVIKVRWTGTDWRRIRRLSGPLQFTDALTRAGEEAKRTGIPRK